MCAQYTIKLTVSGICWKEISFKSLINLAGSQSKSAIYLLFIDDISLKYPFFYRALFEPLEDGWQAFLPENEYTRFKDCSEEWRLSYVNKDYKVQFKLQSF